MVGPSARGAQLSDPSGKPVVAVRPAFDKPNLGKESVGQVAGLRAGQRRAGEQCRNAPGDAIRDENRPATNPQVTASVELERRDDTPSAARAPAASGTVDVREMSRFVGLLADRRPDDAGRASE